MQEEVFKAIADHPNLQSVMGQLLGGPVERFTDQALIKHRAISGQSFFHQDSFYWHLAPEQGCNSWIALDEVGIDGCALAIMPGTQQSWTLIEHEGYYDEPSYHNARSGEAFKRWRIPIARDRFFWGSAVAYVAGRCGVLHQLHLAPFRAEQLRGS